MKLRSFKYHIKQGSKNVFKNSLMSFASIASVSICSFMFIISLIVVINLDTALSNLEKSFGISIYLGDTVSDDEINYLLNMLKKLQNVSDIKYMSKDDALNWAKEEWGQSDILEGFEHDNPFPRSFELTINQAKYQKQVINQLNQIQKDFEKFILENRNENLQQIENQDEQTTENELQTTDFDKIINDKDYSFIGIEKIKHSQTEAEILLATNNAVRIVSVIAVLIFSIVSIIIIFNTIKLTVYIRKVEITIMKYVGATDWFIKWPFVFEGIIIGFIGALIPVVISIIFYSEVATLAYEKIPIFKNYFELKSSLEMALIIAPTTILLGMALGIIGSSNSVKKYLNV